MDYFHGDLMVDDVFALLSDGVHDLLSAERFKILVTAATASRQAAQALFGKLICRTAPEKHDHKSSCHVVVSTPATDTF